MEELGGNGGGGVEFGERQAEKRVGILALEVDDALERGASGGVIAELELTGADAEADAGGGFGMGAKGAFVPLKRLRDWPRRKSARAFQSMGPTLSRPPSFRLRAASMSFSAAAGLPRAISRWARPTTGSCSLAVP